MNHAAQKNHRGQAAGEMLVAIPLLFLLAASTIQFTLIFQTKIQFEHACGEAARQYAAGILRTDHAFKSVLWQGLKPRQNCFTRDSLRVSSSETSATRDRLLNGHGRFLRTASKRTLDYEGEKWTVTIRSNPPPFFGPLFPEGIVFSTTLAVLRHPANGV